MISLSAFLLRLGLAILLGALIGFERETTAHAAGMRTDALVALGSCLFTLISGYGFLDFLGIAHITIDPTRIASYVVAGIGFLGAGSIVFKGDAHTVKGLTTAAAVWLVAAIGMACGAGLLLVAILSTALGLLVLVVLRFIEPRLLPRVFAKNQHIQIEVAAAGEQFVTQVCEILAHMGIRVESLEVQKGQGTETIQLDCSVSDGPTLVRAVDQLRVVSGVQKISTSLRNISGDSSSDEA